jgi:glycerol-3-phosphate acyltransferase PlsY
MPTPTFELFIFSLVAYLVGSISTAIITCRLMGIQDPRKTGSRNPGATNVLRHGGKKAAVITLLGDMLKGLIPVLIAQQLTDSEPVIAMVGVSALLGHVAPLYYGFKGGKGVATFYGVLLGFHWITGFIALAIWLFIAVGLKISSLSALVSVTASPLILWLMTGSVPMSVTLAIMSLLVILRHRSNIQRLLHGEEEQIKSDSASTDKEKPDRS